MWDISEGQTHQRRFFGRGYTRLHSAVVISMLDSVLSKQDLNSWGITIKSWVFPASERIAKSIHENEIAVSGHENIPVGRIYYLKMRKC